MLRVAVILPHLKKYGGVRRYIEFGNKLSVRNVDYTIYVLDPKAKEESDWLKELRYQAKIENISEITKTENDVVICGDAGSLPFMDRANTKMKVVNVIFPPFSRYAIGDYGNFLKRDDVYVVGNGSGWNGPLAWRDNWFTIPGAVNFDMFKPVEAKKKKGFGVLFMAKNRPWKGMDYILKAMDILKNEEIYWGCFDTEEHNNIPSYVTKHINRPQSEMSRIYRGYDIFISMEELAGWQNTCAEALACELGIITTAIGTRDFAINNETALIVDEKDAPTLANHILRLKNDLPFRKKLAYDGYKRIRQFSWDNYADNWLEFINTILKNETPKTTYVSSPAFQVVPEVYEEISKSAANVRKLSVEIGLIQNSINENPFEEGTMIVNNIAAEQALRDSIGKFDSEVEVFCPQPLSTKGEFTVVASDSEGFSVKVPNKFKIESDTMNLDTSPNPSSDRQKFIKQKANTLRRTVYGSIAPESTQDSKKFDKYERLGAYHWSSTDPIYLQYVAYLSLIFGSLKDIHGGGTVLDVGGGDGFVAKNILDKGLDIHLIDTNATATKIAASKLEEYYKTTDKSRNVKISSDDFFKLTSLPKYVLFSQVIEHMYNPEKIIEQFEKYLPEVIIISTPIKKKDGTWWDKAYHVKEYSEDEFIDLYKPLLKNYMGSLYTHGDYNQILVFESKRAALMTYLKDLNFYQKVETDDGTVYAQFDTDLIEETINDIMTLTPTEIRKEKLG